jgi:hypothetical protein
MWKCEIPRRFMEKSRLRILLSLQRTYIQNVIPKFESLFGKELISIKTPMSEGYHPEVDDTPLCTEEDSTKYRSILGGCIRMIF